MAISEGAFTTVLILPNVALMTVLHIPAVPAITVSIISGVEFTTVTIMFDATTLKTTKSVTESSHDLPKVPFDSVRVRIGGGCQATNALPCPISVFAKQRLGSRRAPVPKGNLKIALRGGGGGDMDARRRRGGGRLEKWGSVSGPLFCVRMDVGAKGTGTQNLAQKSFFHQ